MAEELPELTRRERDVVVALCRPALDGDVFTEPVAGAGLGIDAALAAAGARLHRARLLPAKVEVSLLAGDAEAAAGASAELEETAASHGSPTLLAAARQAIGAVALAAGARDQAVAHLAAAQHLWHEARAPYERAQARALLAEAHLGLGDRGASLVEQRAAHATFVRLGAQPAASASARRLQELA